MEKKQIGIIIGSLAIVAVLGYVILRANTPFSSESDLATTEEETSTENSNTITQQNETTPTPVSQKKKYATLAIAVEKATEAVNTADYTKAQVVVEGALAEYPKSGELTILSSLVFDKLGNHTKAVELGVKATVVEPTNYLTWRYRIMLTKSQYAGKTPSDPGYKAAVSALYEQGLIATNNNIELITPYAIFLEDAGDIAGAIKYWKLAKQVNPLAISSYDEQIARLSS